MEDKKDKKITVNFSSMFTTLLTILFIGLKLTGFITWPWVWVLAPLWIPLAIVLVILFFLGLFSL